MNEEAKNKVKDLDKKVTDLIKDMRGHISDEELLKEVAKCVIEHKD